LETAFRLSIKEKDMLKQEQVDFYHEKGYLGVEDVLSQEEVEDLQQVTDEFVETEASYAV